MERKAARLLVAGAARHRAAAAVFGRRRSPRAGGDFARRSGHAQVAAAPRAPFRVPAPDHDELDGADAVAADPLRSPWLPAHGQDAQNHPAELRRRLRAVHAGYARGLLRKRRPWSNPLDAPRRLAVATVASRT